jgi:hypothetical protein
MFMKDVLAAFGEYLEERQLTFDVTIIGGAALLSMGLIDRATQDVDCLDPTIPDEVLRAADAFASEYTGDGSPLRPDWLNNGPSNLRNDLPQGWRERVATLYRFCGITVRTLGRHDLLLTKLFAFCDRQQDEEDCVALAPTAQELLASLEWLDDRDGNPLWPGHVRTSLRALAGRIGYELSL